MARPAFVFCDTDALTQFFLVREIRPLKVLRSRFSVQPLIVPEVDIELRSSKRFAARVVPELTKALDSGLIRVLDKQILEAHYGGQAAGALAATAALAQVASVGRQFQSHVDLGEAYSFAAALAVQVPALSHDRSALGTLIARKYPVPSTVLRAFDLVCLCFQCGEMEVGDCEEFRKALMAEREYVPECFVNYSFFNGLADFMPRLTDSRAKPIGKPHQKDSAYSTEVEL